MSPILIDLVTHVVESAQRAGLDGRDQRDAAEAVLMAAMPSESPAIAHFMVELLYPGLAA
ncbi:hypothetical protein [Paramagnetospirillum kuznetsovii]|uniref:hypothetical protein n=1 Tax=Paramagnetospirillum kuznetsovii TaxID=2053833 RepID=UPI0011BE453F|nr:hypothetical protein [Paramagnetospirillum kuznetsovii]